jgi:hypothetical protein
VNPSDFFRDPRLFLVGHESIFGDRGVQRHFCVIPSSSA